MITVQDLRDAYARENGRHGPWPATFEDARKLPEVLRILVHSVQQTPAYKRARAEKWNAEHGHKPRANSQDTARRFLSGKDLAAGEKENE